MNWLYPPAAALTIFCVDRVRRRLQLSRAKHRSLRGHVRMGRRVARLLPFYEYSAGEFHRTDDCPEDVAARRESALDRLGEEIALRSPRTLAATAELAEHVSDLAFTTAYRVPFQYRRHLARHIRVGAIMQASSGTKLQDLDGNWSQDLTGAYGVNVFGFDFYKDCIDRAVERARELGPVLGLYHPVVLDNARRLRTISGQDEISFHMSGTEAVMQAVALARYHTGRSHAVRFCGAYHGWWDGVQPGVGNPRRVHDLYTLEEMSSATLKVLETRKDIACVLVNPIQAMNPNGAAPGDGSLVDSSRQARYDKDAYAAWLARLREVCTRRDIVLIIDEVFLGFRLAPGGVQEYFGVRADLVTYGKTLGGGLPVGVVCGPHRLMRRFRDDRPTDILFARGTFNSHPYVMTAMNEFLLQLENPEIRASYGDLDTTWNARAADLNARLRERDLPVGVVNMASIWTTIYHRPSRYNWMFQFYLRAEGLTMSWVGSGRFIFSHNYGESDFAEVADRFVRAAERMKADGWWWQDANLTNRSIKRRIMKRLARALLKRTDRT